GHGLGPLRRGGGIRVSSTSRISHARVLPLLAGLTSLWYILSLFLPCAPPLQHGEIEDSYMQALHLAFFEHWRFGKDIAFTYGPWGFLYGGYHPGTHAVSFAVWVCLAVAFWWAAMRVAKHFMSNHVARYLWLLALTAVTGVSVFMMIDVRLKA